MSKLQTIVFAMVLVFGLSACEKKTCANAGACMVNNTDDTVYYAWNSNFHDRALLLGDFTCDNAGEMKWNESFTTFFNNDKGTFALDINDCENVYYVD